MCFNRVKNRFFPEVLQKWTKKWTNYHFWITFWECLIGICNDFCQIGGSRKWSKHHFWSHVLDHFIQQEYNVWSKKGSINVVKKGSKHHFLDHFLSGPNTGNHQPAQYGLESGIRFWVVSKVVKKGSKRGQHPWKTRFWTVKNRQKVKKKLRSRPNVWIVFFRFFKKKYCVYKHLTKTGFLKNRKKTCFFFWQKV